MANDRFDPVFVEPDSFAASLGLRCVARDPDGNLIAIEQRL